MKFWKYIRAFWLLYLLTAVILITIAQGGSHAVTTIVENIPIQRHHTIVIDAGHGGEDGGATSCTGVLESQINLQIAIKLNDLCQLIGIHTVMVRSSDISVYTEGKNIAEKKISDLKQRVKIVNDTDNAILISVHQNTFSSSQYSGAQVFYASTEGSKELAASLQEMFIEAVNPGSNRRSKAADGVYLMQHIQYPGVLIECGFLSNPEEESKLRNSDYQNKLCCVIVSSLSTYLNT